MLVTPDTPLRRYQAALARPDFFEDPAQAATVQRLESLYQALLREQRNRERPAVRLRARFGQFRAPLPGLYLWGGVGRGKTWLVDMFFDCLPFDRKLRMHFHRFMRHVHVELKRLGNVVDPLKRVAEDFSERALVICFDEFYVSDITDAMLLGGLLEALFERGVTLVATSNTAPADLYAGGLQRERFLYAIELLERHTQVVNLDSGVDYRLRFLDQAEIYHSPLGERADAMLQTNFEHIAPDAGAAAGVITIEGRDIPAVRCGDGVIWFEFDAICDGPRAAADYIEIAKLYQTVLIGGVPRLDDERNDPARRFISLVDEFYDRNVKLILAAAAPVAELYTGRRLSKEFERTASRLVEMQSREYLSREHLPG